MYTLLSYSLCCLLYALRALPVKHGNECFIFVDVENSVRLLFVNRVVYFYDFLGKTSVTVTNLAKQSAQVRPVVRI